MLLHDLEQASREMRTRKTIMYLLGQSADITEKNFLIWNVYSYERVNINAWDKYSLIFGSNKI